MPENKQQRCPCCNEVVNESFLLHNLSPTHVFNFYIWAYEQKRKRLVKDKDGVSLEINLITLDKVGLNLDFNKNKGKYTVELDLSELKSIQNTLEFRCSLTNQRKEDEIFLTAAKILDAFPWASCFDDKTRWMESNEFVRIKPKQIYDGVIIKFQIENVIASSFQIPFAVNLQTENGDSVVTISRTIRVNVVDEKVSTPIIEEKHKSPFTDLQWANEIERIIQPCRRIPQLKKYTIPAIHEKHFRHAFREWKGMKSIDEQALSLLRSQMVPGYVTKENYKQFFHNCLWLEEQTNALMLNKYNMENVHVEIVGRNELRLQVPGLAEKRPSLIPGDIILIRVHGDHTGYEGYVSIVEDNHVIIKYLHEELLVTIQEDGYPLDVAFQLGRLPYERAHEGIDKVCFKGMLKSLFPDELSPNPWERNIKIKDDEFLNRNIIKNLEQKTAVEKIANRSSGMAPYIVFGPPGTGKTVTIVEAIIQILRRTNKRILICAPANAACDMLASKLIHYCSKKELIRVHSESRDRSTITQEIRAYSNMTAAGDFLKIEPKQLKKFRIVVSTLILIGKFSSPEYKPEILFVDEAAQALETDVCVALGVLDKDGQIVLAGDPKQLGPIVQSVPAQKYGLSNSLLERLMETQKLYKNHENPNYITMLKKNFRSHSTILEIPNKWFYKSELEAMADEPKNDPLSRFSIYPSILSLHDPKKRVNGVAAGEAMEFCAVSAKEQREGRSPSYFNPAEARMVMKYIKTLIGMQLGSEHKVKPSDIGVITPYIRQVYKIKGLLNDNNLKDVEVGSTEAFQGREKRIIIISTVRAQNDLLQHDKKYSLGFVKQEKRFNVALTRAISKLVVIGCPAVLSTDSKWKDFMESCKDLQTYYGAPYEERTDEKMNDIVERFKSFPNFSS